MDAILDSGCGEGFYVGRLKQHLDRRLAWRASYAGLDIAKDAARMAAARYKGILFVVADVTTKIPFADGSIRVLVDVFAPRNGAEFARILAPGALLLVVVPTAGHLIELRTALDLLGIEEDKPTRIADRLAGAFTLRSTETLEYPMTLRRDDAANLIGMTPNYWHGAGDRLPLARCSLPQQVTASFELLGFARTRAG